MKTSCPHPPLAPFSTRFKLNTLSSTTSAERQRRWRADATTFPTTSQIHSYHSFSTSSWDDLRNYFSWNLDILTFPFSFQHPNWAHMLLGGHGKTVAETNHSKRNWLTTTTMFAYKLGGLATDTHRQEINLVTKTDLWYFKNKDKCRVPSFLFEDATTTNDE